MFEIILIKAALQILVHQNRTFKAKNTNPPCSLFEATPGMF